MKLPKPTTGCLWSAEWSSRGLDGSWYVEARGQEGKKSEIEPVSRTAEMPGQALNVDLLFVPASHLADLKLPAVSGSSGHLVVERMNEAGQVADYPEWWFAGPRSGLCRSSPSLCANFSTCFASTKKRL